MSDAKEDYRDNIYEYCDNNVGEKVLFPGFTNLYPLGGKDSIQDINLETDKTLDALLKKKVLKIVDKPEELEGCEHTIYEVLKRANPFKDEKSAAKKS